jgi:hypothetical protein
MFTAEGKPRYWLAGYDSWHLLVPVALAGVLTALAMLPEQKKPQPAPPPPAMVQTTWISPAPGSSIPVRQFGVLEGRGQPGGRVTIWFRQIPNPERWLTESPVLPDGRFVVALTNFPAGTFGFRAEVRMPSGAVSSTFEIPIHLQPPPPAPKPLQKTTSRRRPSRG